MKVICPYCRRSHYIVDCQTFTLLAYPRVFKDGEDVTEDPNWYSFQCHCLECGKSFTYRQRMGEIWYD